MPAKDESGASDRIGAKTRSPGGASPAPTDRSNKTRQMETRLDREQIFQCGLN